MRLLIVPVAPALQQARLIGVVICRQDNAVIVLQRIHEAQNSQENPVGPKVAYIGQRRIEEYRRQQAESDDRYSDNPRSLLLSILENKGRKDKRSMHDKLDNRYIQPLQHFHRFTLSRVTRKITPVVKYNDIRIIRVMPHVVGAQRAIGSIAAAG